MLKDFYFDDDYYCLREEYSNGENLEIDSSEIEVEYYLAYMHHLDSSGTYIMSLKNW